MNSSIDKLIVEAQRLQAKTIIPRNTDFEEIEKVASDIERYISKNSQFDYIRNKAVEATASHIEKVECFIKSAQAKGFSDEQIAEFMEKNAGFAGFMGKYLPTFQAHGLVGGSARVGGKVLAAPVAAGNRLLFGGGVSAKATAAASKEAKNIGAIAKNRANQVIENYARTMAQKGKPVNQDVVARMHKGMMEKIKREVGASRIAQRMGQPGGAGGAQQPGFLRRNWLPLTIGTGVAAGGLYAMNRMNQAQPQTEMQQQYYQ